MVHVRRRRKKEEATAASKSFCHQERPSMTIAGVSLIAGIAGFVNSISILCSAYNWGNMSSMTGNLAYLGKHASIVAGAPSAMTTAVALHRVGEFVAVLCSYAAGGGLAAAIVGDGDPKHIRPVHGRVLYVSGILIACGVIVFQANPEECYSALLWAVALGMLNGLGTLYGHYRITHVTGSTTDIGICIYHWMCGRGSSFKLKLLTGQYLAFLGCAIAGTFSYYSLGVAAMFGPATFLCFLGAAVVMKASTVPDAIDGHKKST